MTHSCLLGRVGYTQVAFIQRAWSNLDTRKES
jgi:hypothetical protein